MADRTARVSPQFSDLSLSINIALAWSLLQLPGPDQNPQKTERTPLDQVIKKLETSGLVKAKVLAPEGSKPDLGKRPLIVIGYMHADAFGKFEDEEHRKTLHRTLQVIDEFKQAGYNELFLEGVSYAGDQTSHAEKLRLAQEIKPDPEAPLAKTPPEARAKYLAENYADFLEALGTGNFQKLIAYCYAADKTFRITGSENPRTAGQLADYHEIDLKRALKDAGEPLAKLPQLSEKLEVEILRDQDGKFTAARLKPAPGQKSAEFNSTEINVLRRFRDVYHRIINTNDAAPRDGISADSREDFIAETIPANGVVLLGASHLPHFSEYFSVRSIVTLMVTGTREDVFETPADVKKSDAFLAAYEKASALPVKPEVIERLLKNLASDDEETRIRSQIALTQLNRASFELAVPGLGRLLNAEDPKKIISAAAALSDAKKTHKLELPDETGSILLEHLKSADEEIRVAAIRAVRLTGIAVSPEISGAMLQQLEAKSPDVLNAVLGNFAIERKALSGPALQKILPLLDFDSGGDPVAAQRVRNNALDAIISGGCDNFSRDVLPKLESMFNKASSELKELPPNAPNTATLRYSFVYRMRDIAEGVSRFATPDEKASLGPRISNELRLISLDRTYPKDLRDIAREGLKVLDRK